MGFGVAIDDVGTRHSNLETVMALRPHFFKVSEICYRRAPHAASYPMDDRSSRVRDWRDNE